MTVGIARHAHTIRAGSAQGKSQVADLPALRQSPQMP